MKLDLKDYQSAAVEDILYEVREAVRRFKNKGKLSAISLSAPTGSGKTIIATSAIETLFNGSDEFERIPDATILWVSDQPELNEQTKRKMQQHSSQIKSSQLVTVSHSLDQKTLDKGRVYFAHIHQLGKGAKRYGEKGDKRHYPLWDIIRNSISALGEKLIIIVDEAHRGTVKKGGSGTIISQLIDGAGEYVPSPIVIGISATPTRFVESMAKDASRTLEQVIVDVQDVKNSGLIKDKIVIRHPDAPSAEDMTLLAEAVKELKEFDERWKKYADEQDEPHVRPLLVVQVPSGCSDALYTKILNKLKSEWNILEGKAVGHSTENHSTLKIDDKKVRYIRPPDIQDDSRIRVVLFKQALNTGWDCPRAEVMISFATANDDTYVAQTIGRMVRTPLARSISTDDFLNTVSLYLPDFDGEAVKKVIEGLTTDDAIGPSSFQVNSVSLPKNPNIAEEVWEIFDSLPTYSKSSKYHRNEVARLNAMAVLLVGSNLGSSVFDEAKKVIVGSLTAHATSLGGKLEELEDSVRNVNLKKTETPFVGEESVMTGDESISRSLENIDDEFRGARRLLPDSAAMDYWKALCEEEEMDPWDAKVRVIAVAKSEGAKDQIERAAKEKVEEWQNKHKTAISNLKDASRDKFYEIANQAKVAEKIALIMKDNLTVPESDAYLGKHLYATKDGCPYEVGKGKFFDSSWELEAVQKELEKETLAAWYRNPRGGKNSICVPYNEGGVEKPMHPDLIFIHKVGDKYVVDIVDPHGPQYADTSPKWTGLAAYAAKHSDSCRSIKAVIKEGDKLRALELKGKGIKDAIEKATNETEMRKLFKSKGADY